jgi:hypothetical protein
MNDDLLNVSKKICMCTYSSIFIIILFIISPLNQFVKTSAFMKIIILILLGYTLYLSIHQSIFLRQTISTNYEFISQKNTNIICTYIFILFLIVLFFFVLKDLVKKIF